MWSGTELYSPVTCLLSTNSTLHLPSNCYPPDFVPLQPAVVYLKKLNPDRRIITHEHVLRSLGDDARGLTAVQTVSMIAVFQNEALAVIRWGGEQVKIRMMKAAARVGLTVSGRSVDSFDDLKLSWLEDGGKTNVGKLYAICHGDYEGKKNILWSRQLEIEYMAEKNIVYDKEPSLREKGGYELCISHAKGNMVRQIMNKSNASHGGKIVLSLKNNKDLPAGAKDKSGPVTKRREEGEFFYRKDVSNYKGGRTRERRHDKHRPNKTFCLSPLLRVLGWSLEDQVLGRFWCLRKHDTDLQERYNSTKKE